jgi:putative glycosyltransferase (TIGR04372 family)
MGSKVNDKVSLEDENFVDYPFCNDRSPFLDIWLFANCYFTISTGTGQDVISPIFKKPLLCINVLPLSHSSGIYISTFVPKKLFDMNSKIPLSIAEYFYHGYTRTEDYAKNSISIQDLNEFEILEYVQEFEKKVKDGFRVKADTSMLQEQIWNLYKLNSQKVLVEDKNPQALFSEIWISRNILRKQI